MATALGSLVVLIFKIKDERLENALTTKESISTLPIASITSIRANLSRKGPELAPAPALALSAETLGTMGITKIPMSSCRLAKSCRSDKMTIYILEGVRLQHPDLYQHTKRDIRNLARRLQHNEPRTFNLLSCKGFVSERANLHNASPVRFTIVSRVPPDSVDPRSLRDLLLNTTPDSLSEKFLLGRDPCNTARGVE